MKSRSWSIDLDGCGNVVAIVPNPRPVWRATTRGYARGMFQGLRIGAVFGANRPARGDSPRSCPQFAVEQRFADLDETVGGQPDLRGDCANPARAGTIRCRQSRTAGHLVSPHRAMHLRSSNAADPGPALADAGRPHPIRASTQQGQCARCRTRCRANCRADA